MPAMAAARTDEAVAPTQPGRRAPALLPGSERLAERRIAQPRTRDATLNLIAVTSFMPSAKHTRQLHKKSNYPRIPLAEYGIFRPKLRVA